MSSILTKADALVNGPRQSSYGTPSENFLRISKLWEVVLDHPVTPKQAAMCMMMVKAAREIHSPKEDNRIDGAGYWGVLDLIEKDNPTITH